MSRTTTLFTIALLGISVIASSQKYTINGYIEDSESGEKLIAANVYEVRVAAGTAANNFGFYSITLSSDTVSLIYSYIGYQSQLITFVLDRDTSINVRLESAIVLQEIEIVGEKYEKIEQETQMSRIDIPVEQIKKIPALFGEVDVLKAIQLLPGVQSGSEGQTGLYVRGGSPDQNLILLDGVPVYNASHLLGIFSVFNADAIKNVTLTKGGFPARFGGRLSSILEINMKEGNMHEFHGEGSIGLISSKLTLEGPIIKDRTSFLISGRRTYADLILKPIIKSVQEEGTELKPRLFFYDLNAKINHKINAKNRIYLSAYAGADVFENTITENRDKYTGGINWGNIISAFRWNYEINKKLFSNTTLTYSNYDIDIIAGQETVNFNNEKESFYAKYISGITDWSGKIDFDFIPTPNHYIRFGAIATDHTYRPGALALKAEFSNEQLDTLIGTDNLRSQEYAIYLEDDITLGALKANIGLHGSLFHVEGETYSSLQPRLGLRYLFRNGLAAKASFSTMAQYINLLTSEAFSLPTDLWVPSTARIVPQKSWQVAAGLAKTFGDGYEISLEGYYKNMNNVLSFKEGASFLLGIENDWQDKVTQGDGEAYGVEVLIQKKKGDFSGWIGYTLAWNFRQFDDINNGKRFPFRYDRRQDISVVGSYAISPRINLSASWVFGTGNAITLPTYRYSVPYSQTGYSGLVEIESLGEKNAFRMTNYHRLDIAIAFHKKKKRHERTWTIGAYNAYWHRNPFYVISSNEYEVDPINGGLELKREFKEISILPIIPSISYGFKF
jgi:hypothetical protein